MKTGFVLASAFALLAGSASAQKFEKTRELIQEEVPVMVVQSLQKDFSNLADKGSWTLMYSEDVRTSQLTPEFYTYTCKNDGEKVELFYKSNGILDHTKGIKVPAQSSKP